MINSTTHHKNRAAIDGTGHALWSGMWTWAYLSHHPVHRVDYWQVCGQSNDYGTALKRAADLAERHGAETVDLWLVE
jgi:hypothetical protein